MGEKQKLYNSLREKHPVFIYHGYEISEGDDTLDLEYHFEIPGLAEFKPQWKIAKPKERRDDLGDARLRGLVFSLGMTELVSYLKTACCPQVRVSCGALSQKQVSWWKKLYYNGLGEFFYTNGIDADEDFIDIVSDFDGDNACGYTCLDDGSDISPSDADFSGSDAMPKVLIPIGGGKDSAVTLELLSGFAGRFCYMINPRRAMTDTVAAAGIADENVITAKRTLDKNMLELNAQGYLNGHTPFSAIVAFSSAIAAYIHGISYIALSNESSANESTVPGSFVNHQYSKSFEFESDFSNYEALYIGSGVCYFSLLRPLTELGIAGIFSRFDKYHSVFRSCNAGSKNDIWCCACPKCLFVYIILSPFLPAKSVQQIFGKDMLSDINLCPTLEKLIGIHPEKPFECVGSRDEVNAALQEVISKYKSRGELLPALLEYYDGLSIEKRDFAAIRDSFDGNNNVPERFLPLLKAAITDYRGGIRND